MTEHALASPTPAELIWPAVNFIIFVGLLVYYLRGPVSEYFRARTARLREGLEIGARARREAAEIRAALERDIANLPALRAAVRADMRATAEQERDRLIALGRTASDRIRNDARLLAEHEFGAAREALRNDVSDEAVREATALVRRAVRPEDQQRFVREFVVGVGDRS